MEKKNVGTIVKLGLVALTVGLVAKTVHDILLIRRLTEDADKSMEAEEPKQSDEQKDEPTEAVAE